MGTGITAELLERGVRAGWLGLEWLEELALPEPALAELLLHIISAKAASGDLSASRWLDELENRFTSAPETGGFLVAPEVLSPAEWIEKQERLNLTRTDPRLKDHGLKFH